MASNNRKSVAASFDHYADILRSARVGALGDQEGLTADDGRDAFERGEVRARDTAEHNRSKSSAYKVSCETVRELRDALSRISSAGNSKIEGILSSGAPRAKKLEQILEAVTQSQSEADAAAAAYSARILSAMQILLYTSTVSEMSSRHFAELNGVDAGELFSSRDQVAVRSQVEDLIEDDSTGRGDDKLQEPARAIATQSGLRASVLDTSDIQDSHQSGVLTTLGGDEVPYPATALPDAFSAPGNTAGLRAEGAGFAGPPSRRELQMSPGGVLLTQLHGAANAPQVLNALQPGAPAVTEQPPPLAPANNPSLSQLGASRVNLSKMETAVSGIHPFTPEAIAQNFNTGVQAGAPVSSGAEALSTNAVHAVQPQAPIHNEHLAPPVTAPTSSGAPVFETAHAAHVPAEAAPPPIALSPEASPTVVAAPSAPAAPIMAPTAVPPAQVGPLPAYGADLRVPAATIPAAPVAPQAAAPGPAPVSAAGSLNQPAVVRQHTTAAVQTTPPVGIAEKAVAATTIGAAAGAAAEQSAVQQRLLRILEMVARQEPKLRWAIGDREDGSTLLVTDIASGWIPPHVRIPAGVTLLKPARRSASLTGLLGTTVATATYSPGQFLPRNDGDEPVHTSIRSRHAPEVDELGWELVQASKWRDGLPRLAHTLAKAACARTGYLDSEVELLREHLNSAAAQTLSSYPAKVDAMAVGNWQLLATIDALMADAKTSANYHFAWFQALSLTTQEGAQR